MRVWLVVGLLCAVIPVWAPAAVEAASVHVTLTDAQSGRLILDERLEDTAQAVLVWTNSLFKLQVTETFVSRAGRLELAAVTFADPSGVPPPVARPEELEELYHTGGPFRIEGLARPIGRVVFRVGQIGDPMLQVGGRVVRFVDEVGFGGAIVMQAE